MENYKNILAINFGGIGDEIFFLPSLISLKKEYPNSKITLALEPRSKSVKDLTDIIDDLFLIDIKGENKYFELLKLIHLAQKGHFDLVISSGGNKLISMLLFLTGIKERYGYNTGILSQKLLTQAIKLNKNQYACAMYHDLVTPITKHKTELPEINIPQQEKIPNSVLIHPGVSKMSVNKGMTKTVTPDIWADTVKLLLEKGKHVILAGGPDDKEVIESILKKVDGLDNFENYYGKTKSLKDLGILIGKAEKFICSDSAPLHVGIAMKTQTYAIFGPTDDKRLIPQKPFVKAIKAMDKCPIKPCLWEHRQTTCDTLDCLKISAQDIVNCVLG
ncbi:MAG: glycosyltransferase family 9 protein [Clostridiaceae bacterium]|jgi:ADP-heptose:LPS heptosyltransferase|nr:glycosyltransferase family 9 protein [Clostridiaceae bacterium]